MKPEDNPGCTDHLNCTYSNPETQNKPVADNSIHIMPPVLRVPDEMLLGMRHVRLNK